jgi:predicted acetyltransferase
MNLDANDLSLEIPNDCHEKEYCRIIDKWEGYNEKIQPPSIRRYGEKEKFKYSKWLADIEDDRTTGSMLFDNIPCTLYFLVLKSSEIVGGLSVNHANTFRGQLHAGVVPWKRNIGYGTRMLQLGLSRCKEMGMRSIQVAPRKDNYGAIKVILSNGGILIEEFIDNDVACMRYAIET